MIDLSTLSAINRHCKSARSLDRTSPDLFSGLLIVILMGDFYQFPPARSQPLWKPPQNDEDTDGRLIWHRFSQVIIPDERMRQTEDVPYQLLLRRARTGSLTSNDVLMLNGRAITSLANSHPQDTTAIVTLNSLRHVINRHQTENFAVIRHQTIYVFPSLHTRTRSSGPGNLRLRADDILHLPDHGTTVPLPGLLLYTYSMPVMLLTNINTSAGLVNGATSTAVGVVLDPTGKFPRKAHLYKIR